ncbi:syndecan-1 [Mesocricetus auratus]|uniref:Syndecan-1 n=2 Tax=Mesocricetus auratus TaxID=10036 RepID=SDC1_MESAU|nr:syndecan-1 [Mesocricetus auratus]P34740.1 RecName: Full=Syndecan-1; Short=SYND1; AltName: CD_antigen=CD138; Flags: Precursor [Mesocricetus auratus]AAA37087.1 heparan sulfate proteoglycan receptor precursor [Mesocricetus auratus]AAB21433.1 heparan sulfate proteoglycan fibroblast growth factor receptor, HSPG-FGF receptor [hamsters, BHK-21 cell line, Peptide, 309 aa] [Cricetinae]
MRRAALWLWLCALALRLQPVLPQIVTVNVPPEDQDGSGDDSDNFSGSGTGALPDITLSRQASPTLKDVWLLTATPTAPEPTSRDAQATTTSILPAAEKPGEGEPVLTAEVDPGFTARDKESEVTTRPRETTQLLITHWVSTARATTAQAPVTSHPHRDVQPGLHETSAPTAPGQPDQQPPSGGTSVIKEVAEDGATNQLPTGEGSGEQDFTFETSGENTAVAAVEPDQRNQPPVDEGATGASQGLLDRKEVLGGVIAGGLVGLIFAVCLVGFMLYRMKKKDEGSYSLEEPKQANGGAYQKPTKQEEFYA